MTENRYEVAAASLLASAGVSLVRYRSGMSGSADVLQRTIEAPRPRGAISFVILAHEVGHIVLGHHPARSIPRWVQEVEAEEFALRALERFGLPGHERAARDMARHLTHTFRKAIRRGVNPELIASTYPVWWRQTGLAEEATCSA